MYDAIIHGGIVIDGTGAPGVSTDVAIQGDRIAVVGNLHGVEARLMVDATGQVVSPGFIDTHTHSDLMLLAEPQHAAKLCQGVTTEILGQDGLSYAPLSPAPLHFFRQYLAGANGNPRIDATWSTVAEFRALFDGTVAVNTVYLVPHGSVRLEVLGMRDVPLLGEDLKRARNLVEDGLADGAVGLSTGLSYFPGSHADTQELVELCRPVAEAGGVYVTHLRSVFRDAPFDPLEEAIEIGRRSGTDTHISHFRTDEWNAGDVRGLLAPIEQARAEGHDVTLDSYPYPSGSGFAFAILPRWVSEGTIDEIVARLLEPTTRRRIIDETMQPAVSGPILGQSWQAERVYTHLPSPANRDLIGLTYAEAGRRRHAESWVALLLDLLAKERLEVGMLIAPPAPDKWEQMDRDLMELYARPYSMVGSDSIPVGEKPHPRLYGTFPRLLGTMRRKHGTLSLEQLINRVTMLPATRFGLQDRGQVAEGFAADLVIFDPETIADRATYGDPRQLPVGIDKVLVNGVVAIDKGRPTGTLAGRALR